MKNTKRCFQCGRRKALDAFRRDAEMSDGYRSRCKPCGKAPPLTREQRFWLLVDRVGRGDDECWRWTGCTTVDGHGQVKWRGRTRFAHRVSWALANGPIPEGEQVLHSCDNAPCVNPRHLFLGSQDDNVADMMRKGRRADTHGSANPCAKLSEGTVALIRRRLEAGDSTETLALRHGVSEWTVRGIRDRKTWPSVP